MTVGKNSFKRRTWPSYDVGVVSFDFGWLSTILDVDVFFQDGESLAPIQRLRNSQNDIINCLSLRMSKADLEGGGTAVCKKSVERAERQTQVYYQVVISSEETVFAGSVG